MNASDEILDRLGDGFIRICEKGVRVWTENGELRYQAPKDALTCDELERLRAFKGKIAAFLGSGGEECAQRKSWPLQRSAWLPLTFSQLMHWNFRRLAERPTSREIVLAVRLLGRLKIEGFRRSVEELVRRHEALRTQIVIVDGMPVQKIDESGDCNLEVSDLTTISECMREIEIKCAINRLAFTPIEVSVGPLWAIGLARLQDNEHLLVIATEHVISDWSSLSILLEELLQIYAQVLQGGDPFLPPLPIQFTDYVVQQIRQNESRLRKHGGSWDSLIGCGRVRFPENSSPSADGLKRASVSIRVSRDLKLRLREWCHQRKTTIVMSVFTAYVALVLRWCDVTEMVIRYQSDGRVNSKLERMVGFLASRLYLRVEIFDGDTFVSLISRVTDEYCKAYERNDFSYIEAQVPPPEVTRNTCFNWMPEDSRSDIARSDTTEDAIRCSPVSISHPELEMYDRDEEPSVFLSDRDEEIVGEIGFPRGRFTLGTMEKLGQVFIAFIETLIDQPNALIKKISLA